MPKEIIEKIDQEIESVREPFKDMSNDEKALAGYAYTQERVNGLMVAKEIVKSYI